MAEPSKHIVIVRYVKDTSWTNQLKGWDVILIQKANDETEGDMPNAGREPAGFFFAILKHYDQIKPDDIWAFVQDSPFDHCPNFFDKLEQPVTGFTPLGGTTPKVSDGNGGQDHPNLPVAEKHQEWLGRPFPDSIEFHAGGQFMVTGKDLLRYPKQWYMEVMDDFTTAWNAWCAERLWSAIYDTIIEKDVDALPR
jgi:hypothetical protein